MCSDSIVGYRLFSDDWNMVLEGEVRYEKENVKSNLGIVSSDVAMDC